MNVHDGRVVTVPDTPTAARKALNYAEKDLGVHAVYGAVLDLRDQLDASLTRLAEHKDTKRDLESAISDVEMDTTLEEAGAHPGMSVAAMERHLKQVLHKNPVLDDLRIKHSAVVAQIESVEYDVRVIETSIRIEVARLTELGGLLNYLAAIKNQQT